jgi:hypothetical protein
MPTKGCDDCERVAWHPSSRNYTCPRCRIAELEAEVAAIRTTLSDALAGIIDVDHAIGDDASAPDVARRAADALTRIWSSQQWATAEVARLTKNALDAHALTQTALGKAIDNATELDKARAEVARLTAQLDVEWASGFNDGRLTNAPADAALSARRQQRADEARKEQG